jgi:hypothetical protein
MATSSQPLRKPICRGEPSALVNLTLIQFTRLIEQGSQARTTGDEMASTAINEQRHCGSLNATSQFRALRNIAKQIRVFLSEVRMWRSENDCVGRVNVNPPENSDLQLLTVGSKRRGATCQRRTRSFASRPTKLIVIFAQIAAPRCLFELAWT